jgi:hypothetical protein
MSTSPSPPPPIPLTRLFNALWKVLDTRVLSGLPAHRSAASAAFLSALLECLVFLAKRVLSGEGHAALVLACDNIPSIRENSEGGGVGNEGRVREGLGGVVREQMSKVWDVLAVDSKAVGLRVEQRAAARLVEHTLVTLYEIDQGKHSLSHLVS